MIVHFHKHYRNQFAKRRRIIEREVEILLRQRAREEADRRIYAGLARLQQQQQS